MGRSGVKQSELRRNESNALAHRATAVPTLPWQIATDNCGRIYKVG